MLLRDEVEWFSFEMEKVLQDNDHKKGLFDDMDFGDLLHRLYTETAELEAEIDDWSESEVFEDPLDDEEKESLLNDIKREAIDVANFAMAIAWRAENEI